MKMIYFIMVLTTLHSCTSKEESKKKVELEKQNLEQKEKKSNEIEKNKVISKLIEKYKITYEWDTLKYIYSIDYKPVIESKYQLIKKCEINDIYENDSNTYISLSVGFNPKSVLDVVLFDAIIEEKYFFPLFSFELLISKKQLQQISSLRSEFIFVVSISAIEKKKSKVLFGESLGENDEPTILLKTAPEFLCKGLVVDIIPNKK